MKDLKDLKRIGIALIFFIVIIFLSNTYVPLKNNYLLMKENKELRQQNLNIRLRVSKENRELVRLKSELKEKAVISHILSKENLLVANGEKPLYIINVKMVHKKHTENIAIYFSMPVDKRFFDERNINEDYLNYFELGSYILDGNLDDWELIIYNKKIEYPY